MDGREELKRKAHCIGNGREELKGKGRSNERDEKELKRKEGSNEWKGRVATKGFCSEKRVAVKNHDSLLNGFWKFHLKIFGSLSGPKSKHLPNTSKYNLGISIGFQELAF